MTKLAFKDLSILLVEPSHMQQRFIIRELQSEHIANIDAVKDGAEALNYLEKTTPDLVISALYLPDMEGADLLCAMRTMPQCEQIPFMLVSSETRAENLEHIKQSGIVGILPKPFNTSDLKRALFSTLDFIEQHEINFEHYDVARIRILVVDDSMMARNHMKRYLHKLGFQQITEAANGKEALSVIENEPYDLVITDYNMPEVDGRELAENLRFSEMNSFTPILMVTSEHDVTKLASIEQAGVSAICDKPFDMDTLKNNIYHLLEQK